MVELVIRVEEEFDVYIADEDYEFLKTVGDLEMYIAGHTTDVWPCPHIPAFSRLQAGLVRIANCSEDEIHLDTPLAKFSLPTERITFWKQLEDETGLKLPSLRTPAILNAVGCFLALGFFCSPFLILFELISVTHFLLIFLSLFVVPILCMPIIDHLIQKFTLHCSKRFSWAAPNFSTPTLRELTKSVASMNRPQLVTPVSKHDQEVWPRLVEIIVDTIGVDSD